MSTQKKRNSSIELLRIICMLLIVAHHYSYYGGFAPISSTNFTVNSVFLQIFGSFGQLSCAVFAIISGYYISAQEFDTKEQIFKHYKKVIPMIAQFVFYSVVIIMVLGCANQIEITKDVVVKSWLPFIYGNWYVRYYIIFYLFVPFLNIMTSKLSEKMLTGLLGMSLIIWSIIPTLFKGSFSFNCEEFFVVMYLIGAYLRRYMEKRLSKKVVIIGTVVTVAAYILAILAYDFSGYRMQMDEYFIEANNLWKYSMPLTILVAIFVFLLFNRMNFYSHFINTIAASVMGVYLIHDNNWLKYIIWRNISPNNSYAQFPYVHALIKVLVVFIVCVAIDMIRSKTVAAWCNPRYNRLAQKFFGKIDMRDRENED